MDDQSRSGLKSRSQTATATTCHISSATTARNGDITRVSARTRGRTLTLQQTENATYVVFMDILVQSAISCPAETMAREVRNNVPKTTGNERIMTNIKV